MKTIQQGAEAVIILDDKSMVIKKRLKKSYRIPEIDNRIRKLRTRSEAKLLEKASKIIPVPGIIKVDEKNKEIVLEFINGKKLSKHLDNFSLKKQKLICEKIGISIARLHDSDIIHGDLTTSNLIYAENMERHREEKMQVSENGRFNIFFIDFGLGFISHKVEDKAVDLHVLREALEAKHFKNWEELFEEVLKGYRTSVNSEKVLKQFEKVEKRGRYKEQY